MTSSGVAVSGIGRPASRSQWRFEALGYVSHGCPGANHRRGQRCAAAPPSSRPMVAMKTVRKPSSERPARRAPASRMAAGRRHRVPVEADHQEGAVRHLSGQLDHARPRGQEVDGRRCGAHVPEPARRLAEGDGLPGEQAAEAEHGLAHRRHRSAGAADAPRREETRSDREADPAGRELVQAVCQRRQEHRMADDGARRRRVQADPPRPLGGQRQDQVGVAARCGDGREPRHRRSRRPRTAR